MIIRKLYTHETVFLNVLCWFNYGINFANQKINENYIYVVKNLYKDDATQNVDQFEKALANQSSVSVGKYVYISKLMV